MSLFGTTTTSDGREISTREARILERSVIAETESEITPSLYNLIMGGTIAYGLFMNALMVFFLGDAIRQFAFSSPFGYYAILIGYLVLGIIGIVMAKRSRSALISFVGYNLLVLPMGVLLSVYLTFFPAELVIKAVMLTGFITLFMMGIGTAFPQFFASIARTLFIALILTLVAEFISVLAFGYTGRIFDYIFVLIFSLYIGFDFSRSQAYAKTKDNAVDSAVDIYLDIINLFIRILAILGKRN